MKTMKLDEECPICYTKYGRQEDGSFLCMDSINNSALASTSTCTHYICAHCCWELSRMEQVRCPLCREDWSEWVHQRYTDIDSDSSDDDS
jgi:hypothetical protein